MESGDLSVLDDIRLGQLIFSKFPKSAETFAHRCVFCNASDDFHTW